MYAIKSEYQKHISTNTKQSTVPQWWWRLTSQPADTETTGLQITGMMAATLPEQ